MADDDDETDDAEDGPGDYGEVPEGAAAFPYIPDALGVHPLLLIAIHALVFLDSSDRTVVHPAAAAEASGTITQYLGRLSGRDLQRVREDIYALVSLAKQEKWDKAAQSYLKSFLADHGVGTQGPT